MPGVSTSSQTTEEILLHLRSIAKINVATLENLQTLLDCRNASAQPKLVVKSKHETHKKSTHGQTCGPNPIRKTKTTKSAACAFSIHEDPTPESKILSVHERKKLATEAFNTCLTCLTKEVKCRQESKAEANTKIPDSRKSKISPLQPTSPNKQRKPRSQCFVADGGGHLALVAQCATTALNFLRTSEVQDKKTDFGGSMRLEKGALILLDKIISLGVRHEAFAEASRIHEQYIRSCKILVTSNLPEPQPLRTDHLEESQTSTLRLSIDVGPTTESDFIFATTYQSQVLRLAILLGSQVLTKQFLEQIKRSSNGSPPNLILQGLHKGYLSAEKAGEHLRTIAQALLKLYTVAGLEKVGRTPTLELKFSILVEALIIKCEAWRLLKHAPDLSREFWAHISKGLKPIEASANDMDPRDLNILFHLLKSARSSLENNEFDSAVPFGVFNALSEVAEQQGCYTLASEMLIWGSSNSDSLSSIEQTLTNWQSATLQYKHSGGPDEVFLQHLQRAEKSISCPAKPSSRDADHIYLIGARLRKVVVKAIQDTKSKLPAGICASQTSFAVVDYSLRILSTLSTLYYQILRPKTPEGIADTSNAAMISFAKTLAAILEANKSCNTHWPSLQQQADAVLDECVRLSKAVLGSELGDQNNDDTITYTRNLYGQVSCLYWERYTKILDQNESTACPVKLLKLSCEALTGLSAEAQHSAAHGPKLEKLALAYLKVKDFSSACDSFDVAISHYIALGALEEASAAASAGSSSMIWSCRGTKSYALGKALFSVTKLRLTYGISCLTTGTWIYDNSGLSLIQRSLMFEAQISAIDGHTCGAKEREAFQEHAQFLLDQYDESNMQVHHLRFLSMLLEAVSSNESLSDVALPSPSTLKLPVTSTIDTSLASYKESLIHLTELQWLMYAPLNDMKLLQQHVKIYSQFIRSLKDSSSLHYSVDNPEFVIKQLQAMTGLGKMFGDTDMMMECLLSMRHILNLSSQKANPSLADVLIQLGSLHLNLGSMSKAEQVLVSARQHLPEVAEDAAVRLRWALVSVECHLEASNIAQAVDMFTAALSEVPADYISKDMPVRERLSRESLLSRSVQLASRVAFQTGNLMEANRFARQAVRISTRIWQAIEKTPGDSVANVLGSDTSLQTLTRDLSNLDLSLQQPSTRYNVKGSAYWDCIELHFNALRQVVEVSIHNGLYQDAVYYADQLRKIYAATESKELAIQGLSLSAFVHAKAGHQEEAVKISELCGQLPKGTKGIQNCVAIVHQAEAFVEIEDFSNALAMLKILDVCSRGHEVSLPPEKPTECGLKKAAVRGKPKATRSIKTPARRPGRQVAVPEAGSSSQNTSMPLNWTLQRIQDKASALRNLIYCFEESTLNKDAQSTATILTSSSPNVVVATAATMLKQALHTLSSDAVKCVLAETAVALPVRYRSSRKSGRVSFIQAGTSPASVKTIRNGRTKTSTKNAVSPEMKVSAGEQLIVNASKALYDFHETHGKFTASDMLHFASKLQSKVTLLCSTMSMPFCMSSGQLALQSLLPKDVVQYRELLTVTSERATRDRAQLLQWPDVSSLREVKLTNGESDCTMDDLAALPETWSIISISLSDDREELLLSKVVSTRSPFLIRMPLSRSDFDIDEPDTFSFVDAKSELMEIVAEANDSAHDSRGQGDREARKAWYAEREELDKRLESWLHNIENVWFGGFRGLLSTNVLSEELLVKFGQTLSQILDKHLPSRQKSTGSISNKVTLHAHVLELFLGLGHPDEQELDDATTDLLYFVVDILQFSGELNAYDEIDFDAMLVDVFDAMRCYHNTDFEYCSTNQHTVLIVDKELAMFPWESLPCMKDRSISRMPSLSAIMQRLKKIREQSPTAQGFCIDSEEGAYILNPSSDLRSTQDTFQPIFHSQLSTYSAKTNKIPTEAEFTTLLTTKQLLLYFGHGSGAQYVRGRTIRNLDNCAVTLLMGCSSAKMTECGKFESYGMPGYYIGGMSGCMAVVGTLWDVTDRDIDRFALKTMVEWGLIDEDENVGKALERGNKKTVKPQTRHKTKTPTKFDRRGVVSLEDAVKRGRDACLLRYLNGAAPVVYGIPVFLR